jgi:hypothetical protein
MRRIRSIFTLIAFFATAFAQVSNPPSPRILFSAFGTSDTVACPANTTVNFATSYSLPSNTFSSNSSLLRITILMNGTVSASAPAEGFNLVVGGTAIYSAFAISPANVNPTMNGGMTFYMHGTAGPGSSVAVITNALQYPTAATGNLTPFNYSVTAASQNLNTGSALVIQPQLFCNANTAGNNWTLNQMIVEQLQ